MKRENQQENSIKWALEKYPTDQLWLITKTATLRPDGDVGSTPIGYWVIGTLAETPTKGKNLFIWRVANIHHPEGRYGYFRTTEVVDVEDVADWLKISTKNSVYTLKKLNSVMDTIYDKAVSLGVDPYED
jgi:hypothetical protein